MIVCKKSKNQTHHPFFRGVTQIKALILVDILRKSAIISEIKINITKTGNY